MKRIFLLLCIPIFTTVSTLQSQTWFEIGIKGGPATSVLVNNNIFDDTQFDHSFLPSYFFGGKLGVNFGESNGVALHVGMTKVQQAFNNNYPGATFDRRRFESNVLEIGLLYHRTKSAGYFEIGPRISLVQDGTIADDGGTPQDFSEHLASPYYGLDLGFGSYFIGGEHLSLLAGFRFSYGFSPIASSERELAPVTANYDTEGGVHVLTAMLSFELNYSLGYLVRSSCGRRTAWISF
ncbi:MAG: hypothetical protein WED10_14590 [Brumimicrobium sp.]